MDKKILTWLAIAEAVIIVLLVFFLVQGHRIQVSKGYVPAFENPLQAALQLDASDQRFEELVRGYPHLISYRTQIKGSFNSPILADCAILLRTNYVKILIAHGANVEEAISSLRETGSDDAIAFLRQMQLEMNTIKPHE